MAPPVAEVVDRLLSFGETVIVESRSTRARARDLQKDRRLAKARWRRPLLSLIRGGSQDDTPRGAAVSVLLVEDDDETRMMLQSLLESWGAVVVAAGTVRAALTILEWFTPTVVVTDLAMPNETGIGLLHRLHANARWRRIPAIAFTGTDEIAAARRAGFDAVLRKPDDLDRIWTTISRLGDRRAA
jgi:CheY-like chemotaxis protein